MCIIFVLPGCMLGEMDTCPATSPGSFLIGNYVKIAPSPGTFQLKRELRYPSSFAD